MWHEAGSQCDLKGASLSNSLLAARKKQEVRLMNHAGLHCRICGCKLPKKMDHHFRANSLPRQCHECKEFMFPVWWDFHG